jgi:hypothetical protein
VLYQIYSSFEEKEIFCVLFVGMAWVKVVGAVGTFFVGSVVPLSWNYSEPSRMSCQVCLGSLSVPPPPSFEERFCQFPVKHVL